MGPFLKAIRSKSFRCHFLTLITSHPILLCRPFTDRSLLRFPSIFAFQKARFCLGSRKQRGHPCQKQPSTNTATFCFRNEKSGLPGIGKCLLQPEIPSPRSCLASRTSVFSFPLPRIRDMIHDLFLCVKISQTLMKSDLQIQIDKGHIARLFPDYITKSMSSRRWSI